MRSPLAFMVQLVTGVNIDGDGNATCDGADGEEIEPTVGWHFGFYSRPNNGARGVVLKADGRGNTAFLIAWRDQQYELSLQQGECGMKNAFDAYVLLNQAGVLELNGKSYKAVLGDLMKAAYDGHIHGTPVGPSSPPTVPLPDAALSNKVKLD